MLSGILEFDGVGLPNSRVLLISGDMLRLLASITTDNRGEFSFSILPQQLPSKVIVLAKVQNPAIAIGFRMIDVEAEGSGPHKIVIDSSRTRFHYVTTRIKSTETWPPYLLLHIDPVRVANVPEPLEKFFKVVDEHVIDAWFYQQRIDADNFRVRVQEGSYQIQVHYFNKSHSEMVRPSEQNYAMVEIAADGEDTVGLEGPFSSYLLHVNRDRSLEITIAPVKT